MQIKQKYELLIDTTKYAIASYLKHSTLLLELNQAEDRKFVDFINETCLPDFKSIELENIHNIEEAKVLMLLSTTPEDPIKNFYIRSSSYHEYSEEGRVQLFSRLAKWATKTQLRFEISHFALSRKELSKLIKASRNWRKVEFSYCKIDATETWLDFAIPEQYNIKTLSFYGWGDEDYSDWANNLEQFESLLNAISQSGLAKSLKWIYLHCWQLEKGQAKELFEKYKIGHIEIDM